MLTAPEIARVAHQVNAAYCLALGDNSQLDWSAAPQWQVDSALAVVALHSNDPLAGPEASHVGWMKQKVDDGWVYGERKDPDKKTHPCIVPFSELPVEQQAKDYIFRAVVLSLSNSGDLT